MTSCSWLWLYVGMFLMLAELLTPGFVIFFFGLSAVTVGLCRALIGEAFTFSWQLAAFSLFAILYLAALRRWMQGFFARGRKEQPGLDNAYVGRVGKVVEAINPPLMGHVTIGDADWTATAASAIAVGTTVKVVAQDNLTLTVEAVG